MPQFVLLLMLVLFPLQILAGGLTPVENMPDGLRMLMSAAPDTHFVSLSQAILFRRAGLDAIWPQFPALVLIGLAFFSFSLSRFQKSLRYSRV